MRSCPLACLPIFDQQFANLWSPLQLLTLRNPVPESRTGHNLDRHQIWRLLLSAVFGTPRSLHCLPEGNDLPKYALRVSPEGDDCLSDVLYRSAAWHCQPVLRAAQTYRKPANGGRASRSDCWRSWRVLRGEFDAVTRSPPRSTVPGAGPPSLRSRPFR